MARRRKLSALTNYQIRTSWRSGDLGAIILAHGEIIAKECGFDHTFECYVARGLLEFLDDPNPENRIWIVVQEEKVRGSVALHARSPQSAQLRWFWLHPGLRGQGLGKLLLRRIVETARQMSILQIHLWTVEGLEASAHLYKSAGFRLVSSAPRTLWGRSLTEQKYELEMKKKGRQ